MPKKAPSSVSSGFGAAPAQQVTRTQAPDALGPSEPTDQVGQVTPVAQTAAGRAVERAAPVSGAAPLGAVDALGRVGSADRVRDIADRLRKGEMSVDQALEALIDDAVQSQMGDKAQRDTPVVARLREALASYVQDDPTLSARVRRLSKPR